MLVPGIPQIERLGEDVSSDRLFEKAIDQRETSAVRLGAFVDLAERKHFEKLPEVYISLLQSSVAVTRQILLHAVIF